MKNFEFNIRNLFSLYQIPQEKFLRYFEHRNYRLKGRFVCVHNMCMCLDDMAIFGKLVGVSEVSNQLQFSLKVDGLNTPQIVTLDAKEVLIIFDGNEEETKFTPKFIYWNSADSSMPGMNLKNFVNVSRLTKYQLEKYLQHPNGLRGRRIHLLPNYLSGSISYLLHLDEVVGDQLKAGGVQYPLNDKNLVIILDKDGNKPEFAYWV